MFGISTKRVQRELEAKLRPSESASGRGKLERKWYADGSEKLTVRVRGLDLPDGTALQVHLSERAVATLDIANGSGILRLESGNGPPVPVAEDGETVRILLDGAVLLTGILRPD